MKVEAIFLDTHYKYAHLSMLGDLKAIVNGDPNTSKLLVENVLSTMAFVLTTYNLLEEHLPQTKLGMIHCMPSQL